MSPTQRSWLMPWKRSIQARILLVVMLPVLGGALGVGALLLVAGAQGRAEDAVRTTLALRAATQEATRALDDVEAAQSVKHLGTSFGLSSGVPLDEAKASWRASLRRLRDLAAGDARLLSSIDQLEQQAAELELLTDELAAEFVTEDGALDLSAFNDPALLLTWMAPDQTIASIEKMAEQKLTMQTAEAERARARVQVAVPILAVIALLVGLWLALVAGRRMGRRVEEVERNAKHLARGEQLAPMTRSQDEIGRLGAQLEEAACLLASRENDLREAKDAADRANLAKSEFLSRMSHELRTPLNSILGFGQLLVLSDGLSDEDGDSVQKILSSGRHLLGLIDEVLDVSRIEAGAMELSLEPVDLDAAVRGALDLVKPLAADRGIKIEVDEGSLRGSFVTADARRLSQVLLNLLSNAIKYNVEHGSVTISADATGDGRVSLNVSDTGIGIAHDKVDLLFTPFERLGAQRAGIEGTGLGLALSKRLVEAMHGDITLASVPGAGCTFIVALPVAEPGDLTASEDEHGLMHTPAEPGQRLVLYIEDNLSNLKLVERLLARRSDIKLISAMQGRLGVELARRHRPDLVLLDLHLPDLSGEEVLERLRSAWGDGHVPVVAISADATPGRVERLVRAGIHTYLTKPFEVQEFLDVIEQVLGPDPTHAARAEVAS